MTDDEIQALWDEACKDGPTSPGWNRHIRFARALLSNLRAPVAGEAQKPVGRVRHFNYSGIARTGFSQEAVLNDDAPSLPDGAPLYAALQATPAPQPAEGEVVLPSLPPPFSVWHEDDDDAGAWGRPSCNVHTAEQMQEYARVAVLADRQQRTEAKR